MASCHVHIDVSLEFVSHDWHASVHFPCRIYVQRQRTWGGGGGGGQGGLSPPLFEQGGRSPPNLEGVNGSNVLCDSYA